MHPKLVKADFHGSIITGTLSFSDVRYVDVLTNRLRTVRNCRNASLVGLTGVVIYETANAFRIVTRDDTIKRASDHLCFSLSFPSAEERPTDSDSSHQYFPKQAPCSRSPSQPTHSLPPLLLRISIQRLRISLQRPQTRHQLSLSRIQQSTTSPISSSSSTGISSCSDRQIGRRRSLNQRRQLPSELAVDKW